MRHQTIVRQLPDLAETPDRPGAPLLPWLASGALAGLVSGMMTLAVAVAGSLAVGLPWHRPLNVIASLFYGAHLAVADSFRSDWTGTAAMLAIPAMLAAGLMYGVLVTLLGFRPSRWLALKLGLLIGLSAWLITVKAIAPIVSPLTVRLVPVWVTVGLFTLFGAGLTLAVPMASRLARVVVTPTDEQVYMPPRPSRVIPQ